ncbi:MAG TPA: anti-sigma factor [Actinomycetes bacterium]|nr:anti-sigma factor [Actinomycetes bacterium]
MTVQHPQDDLPGLLLGELPPSTVVAVDRHLAGCDPCRRDLAAVAVASSALRDLARLPMAKAPDLPPMRLPADAPDAGLPASGLRGRPRRSRWLLGAAAVLVALLLGIGGLTVDRDRDGGRGPTVALGAPAAGGATAEARMRGAGDDQIMTMTAKGLPRPPSDAYYEVWLVGDAGQELPVGVLAPNGEGVWSLPADVAARYRAVDVTLEQADSDSSRSDRTVLRGTYA